MGELKRDNAVDQVSFLYGFLQLRNLFDFRVLTHRYNMNVEKLKQLQAQVRIGGKGTARRKKKVVHRTATTDDKKLQSSLKKLSVNNIPGIEEVNMIKDDGTVIHFNNPKGQASLAANTFAVTGHGENKQITDLLPGILNQLGAESLTHLKKLASNVPTADGADDAGNDADDDDDVPDLVENFDEASKDEAKENCCGGGVSDEVVEKVEELKVEDNDEEASEGSIEVVDKVEEVVDKAEEVVDKVEEVVVDTKEGEKVVDEVVDKVEVEEPKTESKETEAVVDKVDPVKEVVDKVEEPKIESKEVEAVVDKVDTSEEVVDKVAEPEVETKEVEAVVDKADTVEEVVDKVEEPQVETKEVEAVVDKADI